MEIKNKILNPSIETVQFQVLYVFRAYFSIECFRLVLTYFLMFHDQFKLQCILVVFIGFEAISAQHAIKKRKYSSLIILFVLMMIHLGLLCYHFQYVIRLLFSGGARHVFAFIHILIGFGVIGFVLYKLWAIKRWIKDKPEPETVAYFQSNGSPYPSGPSNPTFTTSATNNNQPNGGSSTTVDPNCAVATVGTNPPSYPTAAVPPNTNSSPYPSELGCPAYSSVADIPYDTKLAPYPADETHPAYPTAAANPAVYPSLDAHVPIQNTDPPAHPTP